MYQAKLIYISCILYSCSMTALANIPKLDSKQPVQIVADHASFDHKLGVAVYEGNVYVKQGSRNLTADKLTLKRDAKNRIKVMVATGNPARFHSQQNPSKAPGSGSANIIKYYPQLDKVDLFEHAKLMQNGDTITGPTLSYNFVTEVLQSKSSKLERTTVILQPKRAP